MAKESVDPVYKYIDNKIKLVRRELQQLKVGLDVIVNRHTQELLALQQLCAAWKINFDVNTFISIIDNQLRSNTTLRTQVIAEASSLKSQLLTSTDPVHLATQFHNKWAKNLCDLGADVITY